MEDIEHEVNRQLEEVGSRAAEIVPLEELAAKLRASLAQGRPLRVKYGIDPTTANIHIGHLVPCRLLRLLQDLGHTAVLIIGDYTARVGDPTDKSSERRRLSPEEVEDNMRLYGEQLFRVVDRTRAEVHHQSKWFDGFDLQDVFELLSSFSVAQMLTHETFRKRVDTGGRLSLHELMYPVMQAYDSLQVQADVEIGGTDQRFNCLCGRDLQRAMGTSPQVVITVPLLMGTDGRKMSKTSDNHISTNMDANEVVGRVMSIPDNLMPEFLRLATDWPGEKQRELLDGLASGALHPRDVKLEIARNIARQIHDEDTASEAAREFVRVFSEHKRPREIQRITMSPATIQVLDALLACNAVSSKSEGRRMIEQGGVRIDGRVVDSHEAAFDLSPGEIRLLRVGKRRHFELLGARGTERTH